MHQLQLWALNLKIKGQCNFELQRYKYLIK